MQFILENRGGFRGGVRWHIKDRQIGVWWFEIFRLHLVWNEVHATISTRVHGWYRRMILSDPIFQTCSSSLSITAPLLDGKNIENFHWDVVLICFEASDSSFAILENWVWEKNSRVIYSPLKVIYEESNLIKKQISKTQVEKKLSIP